MGILDRILLMLYTILIAVSSVGVLGVCLQLIPTDLVWTSFLDLYGRWETGAVGFVLLMVSLKLLIASVSSNKKKTEVRKEAVIIHGQLGDVQVSVGAVKNLVDKTARSVKGVRDVKIEVLIEAPKSGSTEDGAVKVNLRIVIGQESHVVEVSDEVRELVKNSLMNTVGLTAVSIDVTVDDISNASVQKQRVV